MKCTKLAKLELPTLSIVAWRLNLIQTLDKFVIIASNNAIQIHSTITNALVFETNQHAATINAIRKGWINGVEHLISVDEDGRICVLDLSFLTPLNLDSVKQPLVYEIRESTWGCAMHDTGLVATSDNSHVIRVIDTASGAVKELRGHRHNIPCIDFVSAKIILSCSIGINDLLRSHREALESRQR
jgi:WD40 repeat protein